MDVNGKIPVYSSESENNGIVGYTNNEPDFIVNNENPIYIVFGDHTISFNIAFKDFCVMDNVKVLSVKKDIPLKILLFIISSWRKVIPNKGYSRHWSLAKDILFQLPTKDNEIYFDFMEYFIGEVEEERISELQVYLKASGLEDYNLTDEEQKALDEFNSIEWEESRLGDLFERIKTNKLPYKASELEKEPTDTYTLPCLTSSFQNQGLNYFAPKDNATILKNVISIPSNSDVYRAYFQSREFTVLSDAYAIEWIYDDVTLSPNQYLFTVPCINKVTDLSIYSYKNKLGGWNVVQNKNIALPIKNNQPDYETMEILISAIKKLVIKDVVLYGEQKISTTKNVVDKEI